MCLRIIIFTLFVFMHQLLIAQSVGIGTTTPNPSAKLEVKSNNSGFLPPRMTLTERDAINNPAQGLMVYCTDCVPGGELSVYNGTNWKSVISTGTPSSGTPPTAPSNLSATVTSSGVNPSATLNWSDVSANESGYRIERKVGSGQFTLVGSVTSNVEQYFDTSLLQRANYTYRVYAFNAAGNSTQYSNEVEVSTLALPTIKTNSVIGITTTSASAEGELISDGGSIISAKGICWNINPNPTVLNNSTTNGNQIGGFAGNMNGLLPCTKYYTRAYATNGFGTFYGNELSFVTLTSASFYTNNNLNTTFGDYTNTNDYLNGSLANGPYTTKILSMQPLTSTTAEIMVDNIWDTSWAPIKFLLNWTDPNNPIVTLDLQTDIALGSTLVGTSSPYANWRVQVGPGDAPGTFSLCDQTLNLNIRLGVLDSTTGQGGFFNAVYIVNMER